MRNILTSTLFQYDTKFQTFKHVALDRIVERIIYTSQNEYVDVQEIQSSYQKDIGYTLPNRIFDESVKRLLDNGRIEPIHESVDEFKLSDKVRKELDSIQSNFDRNLQRIIDKLFSNSPEERKKLVEPFWFTMSYIFSNLGKYSAKLIEGKLDKDTLLKPVLVRCCEKIKKKFKIDHNYFEKRIYYFFEETKEVSFNNFKWSIAQNYFIANSLGINQESETLTTDIFDDSVLYLDTNILLTLASKNSPYYNNAISFINAAKKINLKFCVADITLKEYFRWVNSEKQRILDTKKQIPENTKAKVGSVVYRDLVARINEPSEKEVTLDEIIKEYLEIKEIISGLIPDDKMEYVDDTWFIDIEEKDIFEKTKEIVKDKYKLAGVRTKKGEYAAIHDAKLLLWIDSEKSKTGKNIWFITADASLPLITINGAEKSDSILLEVILQWMVPLTKQNELQEYQETFSEILKNKLLPRDVLFEVNEFVIFEELHMECAELPSEDVEECIIYLRKNAPNLNPNDPKDREKLANKVAIYFADPGRKYKKELSERLEENEKLRNKLGDVQSILDELQKANELKSNQIEQLHENYGKEISELRQENENKQAGFNSHISDLKEQISEIKSQQIENEVLQDFKSWEKTGKIVLSICILFIVFGVLELLPSWKWNIGAKLIDYLNTIESTDKARYNLYLLLNGFALTTIVVSLFIFSYNRLWNRDKRKKIKNEMREEKRNANNV